MTFYIISFISSALVFVGLYCRIKIDKKIDLMVERIIIRYHFLGHSTNAPATVPAFRLLDYQARIELIVGQLYPNPTLLERHVIKHLTYRNTELFVESLFIDKRYPIFISKYINQQP